MNYIVRTWNTLVRLLRPDVDSIISSFLKAQRKLEGFITQQETILEREAEAAAALIKSRMARNETINRAYRIINNIDGLTA